MMKARAGEFDHQDTRRFKHTRIGILDLYERQSDLPRVLLPSSSISEAYAQIIQSVPYPVRMLKDVLSIKRYSMLLPAHLVVEVLVNLIPAVLLWYSGQFLRLVISFLFSSAMPTYLALGRERNGDMYCGYNVHFDLICTIAVRFLRYSRACTTLRLYIKQFYFEHIFRPISRLDVPTFQTQICENDGLGNPALTHDNDKVRATARLGGTEDFVDELPDEFDTYLDYHVAVEDTTMLFG
ncbi:hypothetical protein BDR07DRAFT_1607837 [Suillus spraguei]|nr:hypothetical protein BDR07DRAFT_1607837 [Suillus spraguei]